MRNFEKCSDGFHAVLSNAPRVMVRGLWCKTVYVVSKERVQTLWHTPVPIHVLLRGTFQRTFTIYNSKLTIHNSQSSRRVWNRVNFEFWILNCDLWILNFELWIVNFELWTLDCGFWILNFELRILNCDSRIGNLDFLLNAHHITDSSQCSLSDMFQWCAIPNIWHYGASYVSSYETSISPNCFFRPSEIESGNHFNGIQKRIL